MVEYPFIKCLHPKRIINPYTKEPLIVRCDKCEACLLQKSAMRSLRCKLESLSHKYCYFVTLTYSNEYVPVCKPIPYFDEKGVEKVMFTDCTSRLNAPDYIVADVKTKHSDIALLSQKVNMDGYFPYLYKKDIQNFMKRFRFHLDKLIKTNSHVSQNQSSEKTEKIRYFATGEYGPIHYRPHYHILLWFDRPDTLTHCAQALSKSWKYGYIDYSLSRGQAASYTAGYLNGYCNLPKIYQTTETRPFSTHSFRLGEKIFKESKEKVYEQDPIRFSKRCVPLDGVNSEFSLWRSLTALYYPKCTDYVAKSSCERLYSYQIYATASKWTKEVSPCIISRKITDYVFTHGFNYLGITELDDEITLLLDYLYLSTRKPRLMLLDRKNKKLYDSIFRTIYNEIRISHHFLTSCCDKKYTPTRVLKLIERYYSTLDYDLLKKQYQIQSELFKDEGFSIEDYDYMYNNGLNDIQDITNTRHYLFLQSSVSSRWENSQKHKKLNDMNNIFKNK